ncbi:MAG: hypothetical protein RIB67_09910 [Miltoncostaeaceae bacterium]
MRAELLKLRTLPTPRWTALGTLGVLAVTIVIGIFSGVGPVDDAALALGAELPTAVAAVILGTWIVGVEYGQNTMHRTLTAEPRRIRLIAAKAAAGLIATLALTALVFAIAAATLPAIAGAHDQTLTAETVMRHGVAALIANGALGLLATGIGLLVRSMAGAVTIALVWAFVIDSALTAVPRAGEWTGQNASFELWEVITQQPGADVDVLRASLVLVAWVGAFLLAGGLNFVRRDA